MTVNKYFPTVSRLQVGDVVSSASLFSGNNDFGNLSSQFFPDPPSGNFQNASGYVGFQFETASGTFYGFEDITVNDLLATQDPLAVTIRSVSYETVAGQAITVAAIPEPFSAGMVGIGAAVMGAISFVRRKLNAI